MSEWQKKFFFMNHFFSLSKNKNRKKVLSNQPNTQFIWSPEILKQRLSINLISLSLTTIIIDFVFFFWASKCSTQQPLFFFWLLSNVCCMLWNDEIQSRSICKWKNLNWIHVSCMQSIIDYFIFISCFFSIWHSLRSIII